MSDTELLETTEELEKRVQRCRSAGHRVSAYDRISELTFGWRCRTCNVYLCCKHTVGVRAAADA
jgi:hypothetical protein